MKLVKAEEAREAQGEVLKSEEKSGIAVRSPSISLQYLLYTYLPHPSQLTNALQIRPSTITWSTPSHLELRPSGSPTSLWWSKHVQDFTLLAPTSISFTAFAVNVPQHLIHLHERIRSHTNARIIQADLPLSSGLAATIREAQSLAGISSSQALSVINALGLSARHLYLPASTSPDPAEAARLHPIRGQTVLVRGELAEIRTLQSYNEKTGETEITYAIPRPGSGTTVLGGCNVKDEWSTAVDEEMTEGILKRARVLVPELLVGGKEGKGGDWDKRFDVIKAQVGLRPGRVGGARVEGEVVSLGDSGEVLIVHAYGMAGAGFQNSVGVASKVLALVEEGLAG